MLEAVDLTPPKPTASQAPKRDQFGRFMYVSRRQSLERGHFQQYGWNERKEQQEEEIGEVRREGDGNRW